MELKGNYKELLFWVLQLVGWSMLSSVIFIIPELSNSYKVYSFFTTVSWSIVVTTVYRYYLKNNIDFTSLKTRNIQKLLLAFIVASMLYYACIWTMEYFYDRVLKRTDLEIDWFKENVSMLSTIINTIIIFLVWTTLYVGIKFVSNNYKNRLENLELQSTLKEAQLNTLKGQVNPHFMFNSLNNIRGLMLEDVDKSREMITKLSEMLHYALSKNTLDAIALSEELAMVENYIALAKIQMEDRLQFKKDIDEPSLNIMIPPMIIQLLIENAAKHGIANLKNGGLISLSTKVVNGELIIEVRNTGQLRLSKNSTKLGLKNIEQRLRLLYGQKAEFSLEEIAEEVVASIKIPSL